MSAAPTLPVTDWLKKLLLVCEDSRHRAKRSEDKDLQEKLRDANTNVVDGLGCAGMTG